MRYFEKIGEKKDFFYSVPENETIYAIIKELSLLLSGGRSAFVKPHCIPFIPSNQKCKTKWEIQFKKIPVH